VIDFWSSSRPTLHRRSERHAGAERSECLGNDRDRLLIDDIVREGARQMPAAALEAEFNASLAELVAQRDEHGRRLVVRNGHHQARKVTTGAGWR